MNSKWTWSFLFLFCAQAMFAQSFSIEGQIKDKDQALEAATIVLITAKDSIYQGFALTNGKGEFIVESLAEGEYLVQVSYLGYQQHEQKLTLKQNENLGVIQLKQDRQLIEGVEVVGENIPVTVKKDTIVYNADAFETQPSDVVEDLLRQMPGVEVEDDGTIIAQGEEVEKVTVDGKEFFGNDPKIATKNLPAKAIDKVEFFDRKSDASEFSGLDDGERTKTMNLELREEYKSGYFGNATAGYGTDNRYLGKAAINRFDRKLQLSILGNINNINQQGFTQREYSNFSGSFRGGGNNINNGRSTGFVDTKSAGINANYEISSKSKINVNYFFNDIDRTLDQIRVRDYVVSRSDNFLTNDTLGLLTDNTNHRLRLRFESEIDSSQDIRINTNFDLVAAGQNSVESSNTVLRNDELSNEQFRNAEEDANQREASIQAVYRKKFGTVKKRIITLDARINGAGDDLDGLTDTESIFYDPLSAAIVMNQVQSQLQTNGQTDYRVNASFVEPLGSDKYLEFNYRRSNFSTDLDRDVFDIDQNTSTLNDLLSNEYIRDFSFDRAGVGYYTNTETASWLIEGNVQYSVLNGLFSDNRENINRTNLAFLPRISYRKELGRGHNFRVRYNTSVNLPSVNQLQPFVDNSDPLNVYIGNPDLDAEFNHRLSFNYINFDQFNLSAWFAFINVNYTRNKLINETIISEEFVRTTTPINVTDDLNINGRVSRSFPIRKLGMKVRVNTNFRYNNGIVFINQQRNDSNTYTGGLSTTLENRTKAKYNLSYTPGINYSIANYSESTDNNLSFLDHSHRVDADLYAIDKWTIGSNLRLTYYSAQDFGEAQVVPIWSAYISRFLGKNDRAELKLEVFDILNENTGISRTTNLNYIQNQIINSLGRYGLLSLTYNLQSFGSGDTGGGRPGGGGGRGGRGGGFGRF